VAQSAQPLEPLDEATFRCTVEPILIRDCSYPACHGNAQFPFRIYSVGKLRDPNAVDSSKLTQRTSPLTAGAACGQSTDERHANYLAALAFTHGGVPPLSNLLLRKPLPATAGGFEHVGGAIFDGDQDPRAAAIFAWLSGQTSASCGSPCGVDAGAP
jgi:hypothetical protein